MKNIVVAIDGHSGCGKSSTAKAVAGRLNFTYIDSGAMYRAATLFLMRNKVDFGDIGKIKSLANQISVDFEQDREGNFVTLLNGDHVESEIRSLEVSQLVSQFSKVKELREAMVELQRKLSKDRSVIMDGRDIGTVVFPNADLKIFMTADLEVRAQRRLLELKSQGKNLTIEEVVANLQSRDDMDSSREESPLLKAEDAVVIDTTHLNMEEQIDMVVELIEEKAGKID